MRDWKNWWYYHKGYVIVAAIAAAAAGRTVYAKMTAVRPDLSAAIVTSNVIPADAVDILRAALEKKCGDYNGDGKVVVRITGYGDPDADALGIEADAYRTASEAELIGDISSCESYLFITDDPVYLQRSYQILAQPDGSCPADTDYSAGGKALALTDVFSDAAISGNEFLNTCCIGRRCFYNEKTCDHPEDLARLWEDLTERTRLAEDLT